MDGEVREEGKVPEEMENELEHSEKKRSVCKY